MNQYAASDDLELWAETVAFAATKPDQVPPGVRKMFVQVISGRSESFNVIEGLKEMGLWAAI